MVSHAAMASKTDHGESEAFDAAGVAADLDARPDLLACAMKRAPWCT